MDCFNKIVYSNVKNIGNNILIIIISIIISIIRIYRSYYIGQITQNKKSKDIFIFILFVCLYYVFDFLSQFLVGYNLNNINRSFVNNIINKVFSGKFENLLPIKDNILNNLNLSINDIDVLYQDTFSYYIPNIISIISTIVIFSYYIPKIAFIIFIAIVIIGGLYLFLMKYLNSSWTAYIKQYNNFNTIFQNIMLNMWNIKYNSIEKRMKDIINRNYNKRIKLFNIFMFYKIVISDLPGVLFFIIFIYNLFYIIKNKKFKIGIIVFLIFQLYKIWRDFDILCNNFLHLYSNIKNINKVCPIWSLESLKHNNKKIKSIKHIEFNNVKYSYITNKNKVVLSNMNFNISKGEIVYINGHSGKGKSTVINLICRLFDPQEGSILINNINIKDLHINSLKKEISVVPQNISVFNNTISENIVLDNKYNKTKLDNLIKLLGLPDASKDAQSLSHGQKQRVLIGRTLYNKNRSVYIFDEYLSAIDKKTATKIHNYVINFLRKNKKIGIFISHDKSERINYDKVIDI